ncbi:MAG: hypothetical protein HS114_13760 [Anaerolineales bacterium]|nr:hypothetical protein [Anaerolineales bacterium]
MDFMIPILMIAGIHLAAVASPGPNFFISAKHGRLTSTGSVPIEMTAGSFTASSAEWVFP